MAEILFIVGVVLIFMGKIQIADIDVEGPQVRAVGFILTIPLIAAILLGFMVGLMGGADSGFSLTFLNVITLGVMVVCVAVAYSMIRTLNREGTSHSEDTPTETKSENSPSTPSNTETPTQKQRPAREQRPQQQNPIFRIPTGNTSNNNTTKFPQVMNTSEAARYLNISENEVLKLIEENKLVAAKINYRYRISRSVLDEFIENQKGSGSASPAAE